MEGWFPFAHGEHVCLPIAEAAERLPEFADASPAARLERKAPLDAGVDAGRKSVPVMGEVSLDILIHGKSDKRRFLQSTEYRPSPRSPVTRR
jgi:hypothetical protein